MMTSGWVLKAAGLGAHRLTQVVAFVALAAHPITAQTKPVKQGLGNPVSVSGLTDSKHAGFFESYKRKDVVELVFTNGVRMPFGDAELRANRVVVTVDRDEFQRLLGTGSDKGEGLPTRGMVAPSPKRALTGTVMVQRFEHFLRSLGGNARKSSTAQTDLTRLFRSIFLEGDVVVLEAGIEALTAKSLMFSVPDNRAVFEDVLMRLVTKTSAGAEQTLVLRAPRLVKQGFRSTARNISLTTCTAGKPHFEIYSGQVEIIERENQFEITTRNNNLAFSGRRTLPLPNAHFFTGEQNQFLIKGFRVGYSGAEGLRSSLDLGKSMNEGGGAVHKFLTGRPADEFRGDWRLGLSYNELRGLPIDGEVYYRGGDLYEGRTLGFALNNDGGRNRYLIRNNLDGSLITEQDRSLIQSENRFHLSDSWRADLTVFGASDPAVYSEFYRGLHHDAETPESSLHLRHSRENRLFTLTGRKNTANFSYGDNRSLSPAFKEEMPVATYDLFSERLFGVGDVDGLLTSSTNAGWLHNDYDPLYDAPGKDNTFRFDQELELAAPFHWGPFSIRPYSSARFTYYDTTNMTGGGTGDGGEFERWSFDAGVSVSTRMSRTFSWLDDNGNRSSLRHSLYPSVSVGHLYKVDGRPSDFYQFDELDSLNENGVVRVGLLNRFENVSRRPADQTQSVMDAEDEPALMGRDPYDPRRPNVFANPRTHPGEAREFLFLDLAQNLIPVSERYNNGETLGLLEFEAIWRPYQSWIPLPNLRFLVEGEHDWDLNRLRTFNTAIRFDRVLGLNWGAGYRSDFLERGTLRYAVNTKVLDRWSFSGLGAYDLARKEQLNYTAWLSRYDHDWIIRTGIVFDIISDETRFSIEFQPLFGGLFQQRSRDFTGLRGSSPDAILGY